MGRPVASALASAHMLFSSSRISGFSLRSQYLCSVGRPRPCPTPAKLALSSGQQGCGCVRVSAAAGARKPSPACPRRVLIADLTMTAGCFNLAHGLVATLARIGAKLGTAIEERQRLGEV